MICPKCGVIAMVEYDDVTNVEIIDDDAVSLTMTGKCMFCHTSYIWDEVYRFDHIENIKEG